MPTTANTLLRSVLFALFAAPFLLGADTPAPFQAAARPVPLSPVLAGEPRGNWVGHELGQPGTGANETQQDGVWTIRGGGCGAFLSDAGVGRKFPAPERGG